MLDEAAIHVSKEATVDEQTTGSQYLYIAQRPSGGAGNGRRTVDIGYFLDEDKAVRVVRGRGDSQVARCEIGLTDPAFVLVYGYRKDWADRWGYGWMDLRDAPTNDPEYDEYQRLRRKFAEK